MGLKWYFGRRLLSTAISDSCRLVLVALITKHWNLFARCAQNIFVDQKDREAEQDNG